MLNYLERLLSAELLELSGIAPVTRQLDFFLHLCPMCSILYIADTRKIPVQHLIAHFVEN